MSKRSRKQNRKHDMGRFHSQHRDRHQEPQPPKLPDSMKTYQTVLSGTDHSAALCLFINTLGLFDREEYFRKLIRGITRQARESLIKVANEPTI